MIKWQKKEYQMNEFDFDEILKAEANSLFTVTEASGMKWTNVKYRGTSILHGKLFVIFLDQNNEPLSINVSYLSSISKIHKKNIESEGA